MEQQLHDPEESIPPRGSAGFSAGGSSSSHPQLLPRWAGAGTGGCRSSGEHPHPRRALGLWPYTLSSSPILRAKMLRLLKSAQFAPLSEEEPGQGAPGSRRTLPQGTFALAVHPSGAAHPDPPLRIKHLLCCRRIPLFCFHMLHSCGSSASPGCKDPPGAKGSSQLRSLSGLCPCSSGVPAGSRDAVRPPSHPWRVVAGTPQERCPWHSEFPCCSSTTLPAATHLEPNRSVLVPTTRRLPWLLNDFLEGKCQTPLATVKTNPATASRTAPRTPAARPLQPTDRGRVSAGVARPILPPPEAAVGGTPPAPPSLTLGWGTPSAPAPIQPSP